MGRHDVDEFLARVDDVTAPTCGTCTAPLRPDGPSLDFCNDECSLAWYRTQGEPLVDYREPWYQAWTGGAPEEFRPNRPTEEPSNQVAPPVQAWDRVIVDEAVGGWERDADGVTMWSLLSPPETRTVRYPRAELREWTTTGPSTWVYCGHPDCPLCMHRV